MQGYYVLENKLGQVVRTLNGYKRNLSLVYLEKTRRVEVVASCSSLSREKVSFIELARVKSSDLKLAPVSVPGVGSLRWVEAIEKTSPSVDLCENEKTGFTKVLLLTGFTEVLLLVLIFIFSSQSITPPKTIEAVTIIPRDLLVSHPAMSTAQAKPQSKNKAPVAQRPVNDVLGVLANVNPGLAIKSIKTAQDRVGQGNRAGETLAYGAGLVGKPLGPQAGAANEKGGYGINAQGGALTLVGSTHVGFAALSNEADVEGGLDRDQIAAVINQHLGQIRFCYEEGLQVKPQLNGRVAVQFTINQAGAVSRAGVNTSSLHAQDVEGCIVSQLKGWKFPEPRGGVVVKVTYPLDIRRVSQT